MRYAIFVTIKVKPGTSEAFQALILKNAAAARSTEPDCHHFHVSVAEDDPDTFHFYEVYTDKAALDTHRGMAHFQEYMAAAGDMIAERNVVGMHVVDE